MATTQLSINAGEICARHYAGGQPVRMRWRDGIVTQVESNTEATAEDWWIAPGLFDLQVNGYGGVDFQQDNLTIEQLLHAARCLRRDGCSRFLLTLITDAWPKLTTRLRHLRALRSQSPELQRTIAGWHIEGPFLSAEPGFHGAHNPAFMLDPAPEHILELREITGNDPVLLTLAPERTGAMNAIKLAVSLGMKVSLGHTNASAEQLRLAVQTGATGFTHLGNACPRQLDRADNILWSALDTPGLTAGLIPDTIHLSPPLFRTFHRALDRAAIYYTTDAMSAAGAPPGRYTLGAMQIEVGADQVVRQPGKTNLAGSALRPIDGVFRAARMLGCLWQEAWMRFSETPARFMGLTHELKTGQPADFCLLRVAGASDLIELKVFPRGEI